jgi:transcriptional regulator with XRE-family HTH domain
MAKQLNIIGRRLARIRYARGLSQADLAARLNRLGWETATRFVIAKIEASSRGVTDKEVVLLAKALKSTVAELFA